VVDGVRITVLSMEGKRAGQLLISRNAWCVKELAHERQASFIWNPANKWFLPPG
jgi:hypothetical protein